MTDHTLLVADIGATNARFSRASAAGLTGDVVRLATGDFADAGALLDAALAGLGGVDWDGACVAVAGPLRDGRIRVTNGTLEFADAALGARLGCPVLLVNDFSALARSLPDLEDLQSFGDAEPRVGGLKAVLGPGSGLGMAGLLPLEDGWRVLPSEGGHADLAPGNPLESEILNALQMQLGHVCWESVLSGPGLVRLYRAVCGIWGMPPEDDATPEWITGQGVDAAQPVCHQTLEIFCGLLGAAAGNLALTLYATGGVYLGGGILPAIAGFAATSPLRRRFDDRGPMSELVRSIPLYLIRDRDPGLTGALGCLLDARRAGTHRG